MTRKFGGFKVSEDQLAVAEKQTTEKKKEKKEVKFFLPGEHEVEISLVLIMDEEVPDKPTRLNEKNYFGPCHFCDMKNICASDYDSWDEFYHTVKNFVAQK